MLTKVTGDMIEDATITEDNLASGCVTGELIANGAVTSDKLSPNCIGTIHLAPGSVTEAALASGCVTSEILASGAVTGPAIANGAVTSVKLAAGAIMAENLDPTLLEHTYSLFVASGEAITQNYMVGVVSGELYAVNGTYSTIIGVAKESKGAGQECEIADITRSLLVVNLSGLVPESLYYCGVSGEITDTPANYLVGVALSTTAIKPIGRVL